MKDEKKEDVVEEIEEEEEEEELHEENQGIKDNPNEQIEDLRNQIEELKKGETEKSDELIDRINKSFDDKIEVLKKDFGIELSEMVKEKDNIENEKSKLENELEELKKSNARNDLLNKAIKYATEKNITTVFIEKLLEEDFEKTKKAIDEFSEVWVKSLDIEVDKRLRNCSYEPPRGDSGKPIPQIDYPSYVK